MNPFTALAEAILEMSVAGVARFSRFMSGPRPGEITLAAYEYARALLVILIVAAAFPFIGSIVALVLGWIGFVEYARFVVLGSIGSALPILFLLGGGASAAVDILFNAAIGDSKKSAKEIFRGFLGIPLWLLVIAEIVLLVGVYSPTGALVVGPLGAMGILLLSFIRKWKFIFGWKIAISVQIVFIVFALLASVPSSWWRGTVGYNLRPAFSLAWNVDINERYLDNVYNQVKAARSELAVRELREIRARIRLARTTEDVKQAEARLVEWERKHATSVIESVRRMGR